MYLQIINPDKELFSGEVELVQFPGKDGSFEILTKHAPIVSVLQKGDIRIVINKDKTEILPVNGGVVEVKQDKILVLAE